MRKGVILFIFLIFGVILFILTLDKVGFHTVGEALSAFSFLQMAIVFIVLFSGIIGMGTLRWSNIIKSLGIERFSFSKLTLVKIVGFSLSYITPSALFGGEPARFFILRSNDENENSLIAASIILDKIIQFLASLLFFFAGLFLLIFYLDLAWQIETMFFLIILSLVLGLWLLVKRIKKISDKKTFFIVLAEKLYLKKFIKTNNLEAKLEGIEQAIKKFFVDDKTVIKKIIFYSTIEVIFVLASFWLIIFFMGNALTLLKVLVIKSMTDLSLVIPFPAALGTLELVQAFIFRIFNLGAASGIALSLVYRGLSLIMAFFGILIFGFFHFKMYIQRFIERTVSLIKLITKNEDSKQ